MKFELWMGFVIASGIVLVVPGPTVIMIIGRSIAYGKRAAAPVIAGVAVGDTASMTLSLAGLGALVAASSAAFEVIRWAGAVYLVYMGIMMLKTGVPVSGEDGIVQQCSGRVLFRDAFLVASLNPKGYIFYMAFLPQFVNPAANASSQLVALGATFLGLALINAGMYAFFASQIRHVLNTVRARRAFNGAGATALICGGVLAAAVHRR